MICFVIALKSEANSLLNEVSDLQPIKLADKPAYSCKIDNNDAIIAISGIGKVSAALTTQMLIDKFNPDLIVNYGTCGGVNNDVKVLNYYLINKCCQYDFDLTKLEDVPLGYIQEYDTVFFPTDTNGIDFIEQRTLASSDRFTCEQADINAVVSMGCSLCDMEGGAIAQVCKSNSTPLLIIKGVSDVNGSNTQPEQFFKNLKTVGDGFPLIIKKALKTYFENK